MAMGIVDLLEEIEIEMQQRERPTLLNRLRQQRVKGAPVAQPRERVGQCLFLRHAPCPFETAVESARFLHRHGLGLEQVKHLGGQIGHREIRAAEAEIAHRIDHRDAKGEVDHHRPVANVGISAR